VPKANFLARSPHLADTELVTLTRQGHDDAYAELWMKYARRAEKVARRVTGTFDPHDLVAESYTRVLLAIRNGGGPTGSFSGYLYMTIRNVAANWARNTLPTADASNLDDLPDGTDLERETELRFAVADAFQSLPSRWQEALWYSEVKDLPASEIGAIFGIKTTAAAMLTSRARQGFRRAWEAAHTGDSADAFATGTKTIVTSTPAS
jgi:RNA polymerase sigma factor (sigma-70 family)